jgi:hypothetical protein
VGVREGAPREEDPVILWSAWLLTACGGEPARQPVTSPSDPRQETDVEARLRQELTDRFSGLQGAEADEATSLVPQLAAAWAAEARTNPEPDAVYAILRSDLDKALAGASPAARLDRLRVEVYGRQADALSRRSFDLGKRIIDGKVADPDARKEGQAVLSDAEALSPRVTTIADADAKRRIQQQVQDSAMEGLYAVERKAMSIRLNRYAQQAAPR